MKKIKRETGPLVAEDSMSFEAPKWIMKNPEEYPSTENLIKHKRILETDLIDANKIGMNDTVNYIANDLPLIEQELRRRSMESARKEIGPLTEEDANPYSRRMKYAEDGKNASYQDRFQELRRVLKGSK